ncbi:MAG: DUF4363 family protein [Clostridia bacterium]|nr:DUF4363 family protein [Clostridia bacterium]
MRKRVLITVLLLFLAMTLSVVSFVLLQNRFSALGDALQNAVYADVPIERSCSEIEKQWDKSAVVTQIFLLHSDLTELRTALESLPELMDSPLLYRAACIRALHLLNGIRDSLAPTVENIL